MLFNYFNVIILKIKKYLYICFFRKYFKNIVHRYNNAKETLKRVMIRRFTRATTYYKYHHVSLLFLPNRPLRRLHCLITTIYSYISLVFPFTFFSLLPTSLVIDLFMAQMIILWTVFDRLF